MRHVIYLLLVANLVFFGWHALQLQKEDGIVLRTLPPIPATAVPLVSLQELEQKQEPVPGSEPELESVLEVELQEPAPAPEQESGLAMELLESEPESQPEPESELEVVLEPELLEPDEDPAMIESLTELQPPGNGGAISCQTLGPIMAVAQLRLLDGKLGELGLEFRRRTTGDQKAIGYWVYLPAMERSQALEIKARLDKHKDKEYYIGKDNLISLGIFKVKSRADVRLGQVRKLGLEAVLESRYRKDTVHWLDIDRQSGDGVDLGAVLEEYPGISLQEQACY
jgi:hypothetical protein